MHVRADEDQKRALDSLELQSYSWLWATVWVLGIEPRPSAGAASPLKLLSHLFGPSRKDYFQIPCIFNVTVSKVLVLFLFFNLYDTWVFCLHVCTTYALHACVVLEETRKEHQIFRNWYYIQMVACCHIDARNWTWVFWESRQCSQLNHLSSPSLSFLNPSLGWSQTPRSSG